MEILLIIVLWIVVDVLGKFAHDGESLLGEIGMSFIKILIIITAIFHFVGEMKNTGLINGQIMKFNNVEDYMFPDQLKDFLPQVKIHMVKLALKDELKYRQDKYDLPF